MFVRWDNLRLDREGEEETHLAGYRDPAVVRRFDAPEAMDIRFYEVRAKSALNRVPDAGHVTQVDTRTHNHRPAPQEALAATRIRRRSLIRM